MRIIIFFGHRVRGRSDGAPSETGRDAHECLRALDHHCLLGPSRSLDLDLDRDSDHLAPSDPFPFPFPVVVSVPSPSPEGGMRCCSDQGALLARECVPLPSSLVRALQESLGGFSSPLPSSFSTSSPLSFLFPLFLSALHRAFHLSPSSPSLSRCPCGRACASYVGAFACVSFLSFGGLQTPKSEIEGNEIENDAIPLRSSLEDDGEEDREEEPDEDEDDDDEEEEEEGEEEERDRLLFLFRLSFSFSRFISSRSFATSSLPLSSNLALWMETFGAPMALLISKRGS